MNQSSNILQELKELQSSLADKALENAYAVPEGYFESLASQVLSRIKALEANTPAEELGHLSPYLAGLSKEMPYSISPDYFAGLESRLAPVFADSPEQSVAEELEAISPLLGGLTRQMPFTVPQGYFENLDLTPERTKLVPVKAMTSTPAKVVPFARRKWMRLAVAAMIAGIITLAGFLYFNRGADTGKTLAKVEKKVDKEIKKSSDQELSAFVQQFSIAGLNGDEKVFNDPKADSKDLLKDVSDKDLKDFLQETADPDMEDDLPAMN